MRCWMATQVGSSFGAAAAAVCCAVGIAAVESDEPNMPSVDEHPADPKADIMPIVIASPRSLMFDVPRTELRCTRPLSHSGL